MLRVCFNCYGNYTTDKVYQWDQNHTIKVMGLDLDYAPAIHFCNKLSTEAIVVHSEKVEDGFTAPIPNILLQEPYNIFAYVHIYDVNNESAKTIELVTIPLVKRIKPSEYEFIDNSDIMNFERLETDIADFIAKMTADFEDFKDELRDEIDEKDSSILSEAKNYSDDNLESAKTYSNTNVSDATISSARAYADGKDEINLASAKAYTDTTAIEVMKSENLLFNADFAYNCPLNSAFNGVGDPGLAGWETLPNVTYEHTLGLLVTPDVGGPFLVQWLDSNTGNYGYKESGYLTIEWSTKTDTSTINTLVVPIGADKENYISSSLGNSFTLNGVDMQVYLSSIRFHLQIPTPVTATDDNTTYIRSLKYEANDKATPIVHSSVESARLEAIADHVDAKVSGCLTTAKTYADAKANTALTNAKTYANTGDTNTLNSAKTYTDNKLKSEFFVTDKATDILSSIPSTITLSEFSAIVTPVSVSMNFKATYTGNFTNGLYLGYIKSNYLPLQIVNTPVWVTGVGNNVNNGVIIKYSDMSIRYWGAQPNEIIVNVTYARQPTMLA